MKTIIECSPNTTPTPTTTATPTPTPITTAVTEIEGKGWVHAKINEISEYLLFILSQC